MRNKIWHLGAMKFDEPYRRFELLETEDGAPDDGQKRPRRQEKPPEEAGAVSPRLSDNLERLRRLFCADINTDLIIREFVFCGRLSGAAVFLNGMADDDTINDFILRPSQRGKWAGQAETDLIAFAKERVLQMQEVSDTRDFSACVTAVTEGQTAYFLDTADRAVIMDTRGYISRSVPEPSNEQTTYGPKEAFTENIRTNVTLLRRIVKTPDLVCEFRDSGGQNRVRIVVAYREKLVNRQLLDEVKRRLARIDTRQLMAQGTVDQLIEEHPNAPVPQTLTTERPDRAACAVMQGKIVLLLEGSPQVSVLPVTLSDLMTTAEDAYLRKPLGTVIRIVRAFGAVVSILAPAYFLALAMHHQGVMSSEILSTVIASRTLVFLPMAVEMIFLLLVFQLIREAGVRVPGVTGQTVGIIGGLIMGQAAVSANIVSTVVLIIVALTGLGNFVIPNYSLQIAVAYFRIALCLCAAMGGLLGLGAALLLSLAWLSQLKSFGVPFLTPFAPQTFRAAPFLIRGRVRNNTRTPDYMNTKRRTA